MKRSTRLEAPIRRSPGHLPRRRRRQANRRHRLHAAALLCLLFLAAAPALCGDYEPMLVTCPVCGNDFFGLEIRAVNALKHRDGDFLLRAEGGNQYATWIWTCPYCFFSARPEDFGEDTHIDVDFDPASVDTLNLTYEAKESENVQLIIPPGLKYRNAAAYYYSVGKPPYFLGVLYLHGSWAVRMTKVSMPKGLLGIWWKSYMKISEKDETRSEEELLLAVAEDLRGRLQASGADEESKIEFLLASTLRQAGEHNEASPILRRLASDKRPSEIASAAAKELKLAEAAAGFQREARRYFKEALEFQETSPDDRLESIYLVGELSRRLGEYEQAKKWFERSARTPMPEAWARRILERQRRRLAQEMGKD